VVLEVGAHSPWVSRAAARAGHDVIVANPRRVRMIAENASKSDGVDAELLARLGRVDPELPLGMKEGVAADSAASLRALGTPGEAASSSRSPEVLSRCVGSGLGISPSRGFAGSVVPVMRALRLAALAVTLSASTPAIGQVDLYPVSMEARQTIGHGEVIDEDADAIGAVVLGGVALSQSLEDLPGAAQIDQSSQVSNSVHVFRYWHRGDFRSGPPSPAPHPTVYDYEATVVLQFDLPSGAHPRTLLRIPSGTSVSLPEPFDVETRVALLELFSHSDGAPYSLCPPDACDSVELLAATPFTLVVETGDTITMTLGISSSAIHWPLDEDGRFRREGGIQVFATVPEASATGLGAAALLTTGTLRTLARRRRRLQPGLLERDGAGRWLRVDATLGTLCTRTSGRSSPFLGAASVYRGRSPAA
jgi:hypothetical protein